MKVTANPLFWLLTIGVVAILFSLIPGMVGADWNTLNIPWVLAGLVWTALFFVGFMRGTAHLLDAIRGGKPDINKIGMLRNMDDMTYAQLKDWLNSGDAGR